MPVAKLLTTVAETANKTKKEKNIKIDQKIIKKAQKFFDIFKSFDPSTQFYTHEKFTFDILKRVVDRFIEIRKEELKKVSWKKAYYDIDDSYQWTWEEKDYDSHYEDTRFVEKIIFPQDTELCGRGDLHGDIHSLLYDLKGLKIEPGYCRVFLGDYTDRGYYGAETLFIILALYIANPGKVILVRGNHEDGRVNDAFGFSEELKVKFCVSDSDCKEIYALYDYLPVAVYAGCKNDTTKAIDYLALAHGSLEMGHDLSPLLNDPNPHLYELLNNDIVKNSCTRLKRAYNLTDNTAFKDDLREKHNDQRQIYDKCIWYQKCIYLSEDQKTKKFLEEKAYQEIQYLDDLPRHLYGYQWGDFNFYDWKGPFNAKSCYLKSKNRLYELNCDYTEDIFKNATNNKRLKDKTSKDRLCGLFRAHQHDSETLPRIIRIGKGIFLVWGANKEQWSGSSKEPLKLPLNFVVTFNVAPRAGYQRICPEWKFDTVASLKFHKEGFEKWVFQPRNIYYEDYEIMEEMSDSDEISDTE